MTATIFMVRGISTAVDNYKDDVIISHISGDFKRDIITGETHKTQNGKYYYYDYDDIAKKVMQQEDVEEAVYLLIKTINQEQTERVLAQTPYKSLEIFIQSRGYDSIKDFKDTMARKIVLEQEIIQNKKELEEMQEEHVKDDLSESIEGRKK